MFWVACVKVSVQGGHAWWQGVERVWCGVCMVAGRGCTWWWWGACILAGGVHGGGGGRAWDTTRYGQWAGGTHPTGMHSCLMIDSRVMWRWLSCPHNNVVVTSLAHIIVRVFCKHTKLVSEVLLREVKKSATKMDSRRIDRISVSRRIPHTPPPFRHACPLCHTCPPFTTHGSFATHAPFAMHASLTMHTPFAAHAPLCHTCPPLPHTPQQPCTPPWQQHMPPLWTDTHL